MWSGGLRFCRSLKLRHKLQRFEPFSTAAEPEIITNRIVERIQEHRRRKSLASSSALTERISSLLTLFPLAEVTVERVLITTPELLRYHPLKIQEYCQIIAETGDHNLLSSEEALALVGVFPELLKWTQMELKSRLSELFGQTAEFKVPWNVVLLASPQLLLYQSQAVALELEKLLTYFSPDEMYHLLGNNSTLLDEPFHSIEQKLLFLMKTMNVSAKRIAQSRASLTQPLYFYQLRYEFLLRAGNYQHPDHNQQGQKLVEAKPNFALIISPSDRAFIKACAPTLTLEEFNVFKAIFDLEQDEKKKFMPDFDAVDDEAIRAELNELRGSYGKALKSKKKKKDTFGK